MLFGVHALRAAALAKKKKAAPARSRPMQRDRREARQRAKSRPSQVGDTEKPKTILDTSQDAPKTDSLGHVHFGSPNAEGLGRVAVKAPPESKIKIFLEGRYFGTAPLTIYSVPKGDYIVEAVYANGKQVSRPVTVGENEETAVDLGGAQALRAASGPGMFDAEMTPTRMTVDQGRPGRRPAVGAVAAIGVRHPGAQDRERLREGRSARRETDDLENKGNRYALLTNVGIAWSRAVGLIVAGIAGYPLVLQAEREDEDGVHVHADGDARGTRRRADRPLLATRRRFPDPAVSAAKSEHAANSRREGPATSRASRCRSRGCPRAA